MQLIELAGEFSVCKLAAVPQQISQPFSFLAVTDEEISWVCPSKAAPADALTAEHGWRVLKISGVLDFGMVGVIAKISGLLAQQQISLFVISTYNTDYILIKSARFGEAMALLQNNNYEIIK